MHMKYSLMNIFLTHSVQILIYYKRILKYCFSLKIVRMLIVLGKFTTLFTPSLKNIKKNICNKYFIIKY